MNLTEEQVGEFKKKLVEERSSVLKKLLAAENTVDFGSDVDNFEEEEDEAEEFSNQLGLKKIWQSKIEDIDTAIEKIKGGKYGVCERCKKGIEIEVLKAEPSSKLCRQCKLS